MYGESTDGNTRTTAIELAVDLARVADERGQRAHLLPEMLPTCELQIQAIGIRRRALAAAAPVRGPAQSYAASRWPAPRFDSAPCSD
jgi:hypothetical protein